MTGRVYAWPRHLRATCPEGGSDYRCDDGTCVHVNLFACVTCGGAEGDLPTDCPGEHITWPMRQSIYNGDLNYLRGPGWVRPGDRMFKDNG